MADILRPDEIEALLSALDKGEILPPLEDKKMFGRFIKEYDFKRPDKFSKDQLRVLQMIIENFTRNWGTFLSAKMRSVVHINIDKIGQLTYEEYLRGMTQPWVIVVYSAAPLEGNALFEFSPMLTFGILDKLLGGYGGAYENIRELTEIEEAIFSTVVNDGLRYFRESMKEVEKITPRIESIESNPQFVQIVPPAEIVLSVSMDMQIDDFNGLLGFCFPFLLLEPISNELKTKSYFSSNREVDKYKPLITDHLKNIKLPVSGKLGSAQVNVRDVLDLEVGDVLKLDTLLKDPIEIQVSRQTRWTGRTGLSGKFRALKIEKEAEDF
ncbi:flagellar motor switch protein FliM [bacterium]|nr:flagellar motor switch protein FliM [bacterium]MBU1024539.1 flagellar motor switch protein FliM [bacterium]